MVFCLYVPYGKSLLITGFGCERTCLLSVRMAVACLGLVLACGFFLFSFFSWFELDVG